MGSQTRLAAILVEPGSPPTLLGSQTRLAAILVQPGSLPTLYGEPESGLSLRKWLNEGCLDALLWNLGGSIAF